MRTRLARRVSWSPEPEPTAPTWRPWWAGGLTVLLAVLHLLVVHAQTAEVLDRVLAVAAGDVILLSDVRAARDLGLVPDGGAPDPDRAVLTALIDRALMLDEVDRYATGEALEADVERALDEVRTRVGSPSALTTVLARIGLSERQLRETLRQNLRIRAYLAQRFSGDTRERTQAAIGEWVLGLRRRADIVDVYKPAPR
ncbi:MAG: hypothetical protein ABL961_13595 [Vicinamibacterales bacterium]